MPPMNPRRILFSARIPNEGNENDQMMTKKNGINHKIEKTVERRRNIQDMIGEKRSIKETTGKKENIKETIEERKSTKNILARKENIKNQRKKKDVEDMTRKG
jgi:hypothetical protein